MSYIDKIYNDKNQTKLIWSFRSQHSGYLWGKRECGGWEEAQEEFLNNMDIPFGIIQPYVYFVYFSVSMLYINRNLSTIYPFNRKGNIKLKSTGSVVRIYSRNLGGAGGGARDGDYTA